MSEENKVTLNDEALDEVSGGSKLGTKKDKVCLECQIRGQMNNPLYKKNGLVYCPACGAEYPGID